MKPGKLLVFLFLCLLLCLCSAACAEVSLNSDNFPDSAFLGAITPYDRDGDGALSDQEIAGVTDLDLRERGITSLKGIEVFENLTSLYVNDNSLTELDLRKNTLAYLGVQNPESLSEDQTRAIFDDPANREKIATVLSAQGDLLLGGYPALQ